MLMEKKLVSILFIVLTICIVLAIGYFLTGKNVMEGLQVNTTTVPIPADGVINSGYYKVDEKNMAVFPAGSEVRPLPYGGKNNVPYGYYVVNIEGKDMMARVPSGYRADSDKTTLIPTTLAAMRSVDADISGTAEDPTNIVNTTTEAPSVTYDSNNYNIQYHDSAADLAKQGIYDISFSTMYVKDNTGNIIALDFIGDGTTPTYYQPGSFVFGSTNFVPNYEDSVYLSRLTGVSQVAQAPVTQSAYSGFCSVYKNDMTGLESKCNSLDKSVCSSTSCCVLVGGSKCTTGNELGPKMKSVYSDPGVINKDYYHYMGKCYGHCP